MTNESPSERRARLSRENRDRCHEAAQRFRRWVAQDTYAGFRHQDDGWHYADLLDSAALMWTELPERYRSRVLAAVARILDDAPDKAGPVDPLSAGDGH